MNSLWLIFDAISSNNSLQDIDWSKDDYSAKLKNNALIFQSICKTIQKQTKDKAVMHHLRLAITHQLTGPSLYDAMAIFGKTKCLALITHYCDTNCE